MKNVLLACAVLGAVACGGSAQQKPAAPVSSPELTGAQMPQEAAQPGAPTRVWGNPNAPDPGPAK